MPVALALVDDVAGVFGGHGGGLVLAHPVDDTAGRSFLDLRATCDENVARDFMANLVGAFIHDVTKPTTSPTVVPFLSHLLVGESQTK